MLRCEFINNFEIMYTSEYEATVYVNGSDLGFVVTSDEPVKSLVMFLIGVDSVDEYLSRHLEDTGIINLERVS